MTKSDPKPDGPGLAEPGGERKGPSPELVERFRQFESRVDEAVRLIAKLKEEKQMLEARLDEAARARAEAVQRIDALVDKIDGLL